MSRTKSRREQRFHSNIFQRIASNAFQIEKLERRNLMDATFQVAPFAGVIGTTQVGGAIVVANGGFSGVLETEVTQVEANRPNADYDLMTGDIIMEWYQGGGVAEVPQVPNNPGSITTPSNGANTPVTLSKGSAGTALTEGPDKGDYILYYYYGGDGNFAPSHQFDSADYALAQTQGVTGDAYPVKFTDTSAPGVETQVSFIQQPQNAAQGDKISPAVTVVVQDSSGATVTGSSSVVTLSLSGGDGTATLSGITTAAVVNGIATFNNLSVDKSGNYNLTASSGTDSSSLSSAFTVTAGKLVFIKQPHNGTAGESLNPPVIVALENSKNKIVTDDSSSIVTLSPVGATAGNPITGNSVQLFNGEATFSSLQLSEPGTYSLQATDGGDAQVSSAKFQIGGDHLVFTKQPASTDVNAPITFSVALEDSKNKINTDDNSDQVQISLQTVQAGANAALTGATTLAFVNGVATFTVAQALEINSVGTFILTATELDSTDVPVAATPTATSKPLKVGGFHLVFTKKPPTTSVNAPVLFTVAIEDAKNKIDTTDDTTTLSIVPLLSSATSGVNSQFTVTPANPVMVNGIATFNSTQLLSIQDSGSYTITATALDTTLPINTLTPLATVEPATSNAFKVMGYHLSFVEQPGTTKVNAPVIFSVAIRDFHNGVVETDESTPLQILPLAHPFKSGVNAEFTLTPTNPIAHDGVFIFDASTLLSFQNAGTYTITAIALDSSVPLSTLTPLASIASVTSKPFKII
jgi:hypothetical protein